MPNKGWYQGGLSDSPWKSFYYWMKCIYTVENTFKAYGMLYTIGIGCSVLPSFLMKQQLSQAYRGPSHGSPSAQICICIQMYLYMYLYLYTNVKHIKVHPLYIRFREHANYKDMKSTYKNRNIQDGLIIFILFQNIC